MIYETLQILREQLEAFFIESNLGRIVILDNIAQWDSESAGEMKEKLVITLLKIEEETTMNNNRSYIVREDKYESKYPPVFLNIHILISANFEKYSNSLNYISKTIEFFQGKSVFTPQNTVFNREDPSMKIPETFQFNLRLFSPTFEEMNNIWGTLGGKQLPFVIYKIQLISIIQEKIAGRGGIITHVEGNLKNYRQ